MGLFADRSVKKVITQIFAIVFVTIVSILILLWNYLDQIQDSIRQSNGQMDKNFIFIVVLVLVGMLSLMMAVLIHYFVKRDQILRDATRDISRFLEGDTSIRLMSYEEGSLSVFFHAVNEMAKSLQAHAQKESKSREFLNDMITEISHQMKTPLAALQMYNEILREEKSENAVINDFLDKTNREISRMSNLIKNLLKLARLDAGMVVLEQREGAIGIFLEEIVEDFQTRARLEGKTLIFNGVSEIRLSYDEEWLYEALSNLVKNALDHTDSGDKICIAAEETLIRKEITISDTGSGIHPEDMPHIFKKFYRSRYSKDRQGTGIGLTLAATIIERHGGMITVTSELGRGTTFTITFLKLTNM